MIDFRDRIPCLQSGREFKEDKKTLNLYSSLAVTFAAGFGAGAVLAFFCLRSKLSLYRHFIEDRLSSLETTRQYAQVGRAQ